MENKILFAKENKSIKEHIEDLNVRIKSLQELYGYKIESIVKCECDKRLFWYMLKIAIAYHDIGKSIITFQNLIRKNIGQVYFYKASNKEVPNLRHNYISVVLVDIKSLKIEDVDLIIVILQSILSHHDRSLMCDLDSLKSNVDSIIKLDLMNRLDEISSELIEPFCINKHPSSTYLQMLKRPIISKDKYYKTYIMLAGLLQKLDYAASAQLEVEIEAKEKISTYVKNKFDNLRDIQKYCESNRNRSLIVSGSTGIGKTEAALLWSDEDKSFITLPYKNSINATYSRVKDLGYEEVGLLHSTALYYLDEDEFEDVEEEYSRAKLLSYKTTVTTVDQLFRFVLRTSGYERILATLAYSKIVIDEIQSYDPELAAIIIVGLKMIHEMGGKFLIMSATIPTLYIDKLKELDVIPKDYEVKKFISDEKNRHCINIQKGNVQDNIKNILLQASDKKILVFSNTVGEAINIYECIKSEIIKSNGKLGLLHARFIQRDRVRLEKEIKQFSDSLEVGIWITTNLAEVSLDLNFDIVHTELSTLDSLFQRMGRCNRYGFSTLKGVNVYVYEDSSGIGTVYDKDLVGIGLELLMKLRKNKSAFCIYEENKNKLVEQLYSKELIKNTSFYRKFENTFIELNKLEPYQIKSKVTSRILRNIDSIKVIPRKFVDMKEDLFIDFDSLCRELCIAKKSKDNLLIKELRKKKRELIKEIESYTIDINRNSIAKNKISEFENKNLRHIRIVELEYNSELGLILKNKC